MFDSLQSLPPDPILGVNAAFRRDESPHKIDLGIGVYRDQAGNTPVPAAVREAERAILAAQTSKTYVGPAGNAEFNERITELALGPLARDAAVTDRRDPDRRRLRRAARRCRAAARRRARVPSST